MDSAGFAIVTPVSLSTKKGVYKGMSVEAWDPVSAQRIARRASAVPSRGRSLQVSVMPTNVDLPLGSTPAHVSTFPGSRDDESSRSRRRRRRHSEHPHSHRGDGSENRPATGIPPVPSIAPPQRPQRHPTLNLHDVEDAFAAREEPRPARRWADTPGAASVATWVREQQVQAQYQFPPLSPPPTAKAQTSFLGKMKKLMGKQKSSGERL